MIDISIIRDKPEWVKEQIAKLNDTAPIDEILAADIRRREILGEVEALRKERNDVSKQIGQRMGELKKTEARLRQAEAGQAAGATVAWPRAPARAPRARIRRVCRSAPPHGPRSRCR